MGTCRDVSLECIAQGLRLRSTYACLLSRWNSASVILVSRLDPVSSHRSVQIRYLCSYTHGSDGDRGTAKLVVVRKGDKGRLI